MASAEILWRWLRIQLHRSTSCQKRQDSQPRNAIKRGPLSTVSRGLVSFITHRHKAGTVHHHNPLIEVTRSLVGPEGRAQHVQALLSILATTSRVFFLVKRRFKIC